MTAIACTPSMDDDMMPRTVPAPESPAPLRQQARRRSSLDFLKKAATSGSTRIRSISNTSIRSLFAQDASISNTNDGDNNADNAECASNNVPGEITIGGDSGSAALAEPTANPTARPSSGPARRSRRRSSSINSDKTRDSFEVMIRNAGGSDDVRRGSQYRPRSSTLEELAMMSTAVVAGDNDDEDNKSDEVHIHRLVACLNMTSADCQEGRTSAMESLSSNDVRRRPTKSILRSSSQPNLDEPNVDGTNVNNDSATTPAVMKSRFLRRRSTSSIIVSPSKRCKGAVSQ